MPSNAHPKDAAAHLSLTRARWELRFYIWRSVIGLTVASAAACDLVLSLMDGRPPNALTELRSLLPR